MRVYPKVDRYTELGTLRSQSDMDREYQRLLARDRNPLSFLYGGMSQISFVHVLLGGFLTEVQVFGEAGQRMSQRTSLRN